MDRILVCGDTHGSLDLQKVKDFFQNNKQQHFSKNDYLIILGDVGIYWDNTYRDRLLQQTLTDLPVTTLWIDGNHENFDLIEHLPVTKWNGGKVQKTNDSLIHLMRGEVYEIGDRTIFTFGGGLSIDKADRIEGRSWWSQEMPTKEEMDYGWDNLSKVNFNVDYILTHSCPLDIAKMLVSHIYPGEESLQYYFHDIARMSTFHDWYFGHWHTDRDLGRFHGLYQNIVELPKERERIRDYGEKKDPEHMIVGEREPEREYD